MGQELRIPLAAVWVGGVVLAAVVALAFFWNFPEFLVYVFLAMVAVVAAGGLRFVVAAWLDPRGHRLPGPASGAVTRTPAEARPLPASAAAAPPAEPAAQPQKNGEPEP